MTYLKLAQPIFTIVRLLLTEGQVNQLTFLLLDRGEGNHVLVHLAEVLPSIFVFARTQTLSDNQIPLSPTTLRDIPCSISISTCASQASLRAISRTQES